MPYTAEISRSNPTCFLFLIDQSGSMADALGDNSGRNKAEGVATAVNRIIQELVYRCAKGEHILDRYYIGVIGYGDELSLGFTGDLAGEVLCPVSAVGNKPLRIENRKKLVDDGAGGVLEQTIRFPVWVDPLANGGTPMCEAIRAAHAVISEFIDKHPRCFPPIVINITDGEATDGDPEPLADQLRTLASEDGNVLMMNLHISSQAGQPILFPASDANLPDQYAERLFRMSSPLPPTMLRLARSSYPSISDGARGFGFNADMASLAKFLDIGTRVAANR